MGVWSVSSSFLTSDEDDDDEEEEEEEDDEDEASSTNSMLASADADAASESGATGGTGVRPSKTRCEADHVCICGKGEWGVTLRLPDRHQHNMKMSTTKQQIM